MYGLHDSKKRNMARGKAHRDKGGAFACCSERLKIPDIVYYIKAMLASTLEDGKHLTTQLNSWRSNEKIWD